MLDSGASYGVEEITNRSSRQSMRHVKGYGSLKRGLRSAAARNYQLANRLAFTWKLASLGLPTVLIYLGFYGDRGIGDAGAPFESDDDWKDTFKRTSAE